MNEEKNKVEKEEEEKNKVEKEEEEKNKVEKEEEEKNKVEKEEESLKILKEIKTLKESYAYSLNENKRLLAQFDQNIFFNNKKWVLKILDFLVNLERALEYMKKDSNQLVKGYYEGLIMLKESLIKAINKENVEEINVKEGDVFNSNIHEVIDIERENNKYKGEEQIKVIKVIEKGYFIKDIVIKQAKIIIFKNN